MMYDDYKLLNSRRRTVLYYAISLCCVIALMVFASSLRPLPVEETITVDSTQATPEPVATVVHDGALPIVDPDIETAGDKVAAAVIYLKRRQSESALNALQQAQVAANRAVTKKTEGSKTRDELISTSQEIERVKELIRKGRMGNAGKELKHIDQTLDSVTY
jgi:fructose-bisphosphate aldolase class 1